MKPWSVPCGRRRAAVPLLAVLVLGCEPSDPDLVLVGTVERTLVELVAPISESIVEISAERGNRVSAGQVIVRIDPVVAEARVASAQATLSGTQTAVIVAQHDLERLQQLRVESVASERELERAQLTRSEAYARLREAEALVEVALEQRRDLDLAPSVDGVLDQLPYEVGERVPAGAVVAVLLADSDPWVRVWIPERRFVDVGPGIPAEIRIDGIEQALRGSVLEVARQPEFTPHYALTERDRVHLVYETRVTIHDAPASLRPGVPAEVRIRPPAP